MKFNDALPGAMLILFGAGVFLYALGFPPMPGQDYGAALFPQVIAVLMAVCGLVLIVKATIAPQREPMAVVADWMRSPAHLLNFLLLISLLLFYIFAADALGFIPTAIIMLAALMLRLRGAARLGSSLAIAAAASLVIQQFFGEILRVPLPWGIVPPFSW
jgi:putative tricarboxylic transport membrane protein